ncbi:MAG: hypothetical protein ACR2FO_03485 [Actinomycetota bacterium]
METEGHPTQDLVDELQRRGGVLYQGTTFGPDKESSAGPGADKAGVWLFLPEDAWQTDIDETPSL